MNSLTSLSSRVHYFDYEQVKEQLPDEIFVRIMFFMDVVPLSMLSVTNKHFSSLSKEPSIQSKLNDSPSWKKIFSEERTLATNLPIPVGGHLFYLH